MKSSALSFSSAAYCTATFTHCTVYLYHFVRSSSASSCRHLDGWLLPGEDSDGP
ncbi:hypothetical protein PF005_g5752 [Phytophthora fragariae]|uniref:Uncharacterized protein n=2 Tax=Phytophthora TaxID=4783 RepID=A0A6A3YV06_9STRA|nr:hypothetical protein PF003_g39791 [Phytophthora fragariae]KAE8999498.1 hypothetical protein PR002_g18435 [Phytophthora rubi]KAE8943984.1 hypothetical protein PF009_g6320 [Phytophthora fragariae]KAE9002969.1 hypothetical protein PR001_g18106 [Phytophthora rubi]KAE9021622.1 hypothetical protein PF011_g4863 [Phytophthora fragariae]